MENRIDPKSLRIGNYLQGDPLNIPKWGISSDGIVQITAHGIYLLDEMHREGKELPYKPIPLSEQELIRLGFKNVGGCGSFRWQTDEYMLERWITTSNWCFRLRVDPKTSYEMAKVQFLHELQNLYYSLTGTELTYKAENETIKP